MTAKNANIPSQLAARLASAVWGAGVRKLTIDTTVRKLTLTPGGWRLYGSATQVYYAVRRATDASGSTLDTGEVAPTTSQLAAPGTTAPAAGALHNPADIVTCIDLTTDISEWHEISVAPGKWLNLYCRVAAGTANPHLEGPFPETD